MGSEKDKSVNLVSVTGVSLATLDRIERDGDRLLIQSSLMGLSFMEVYLCPGDVLKMLGMIFTPKVMGYVFSLPYILIRKKIMGR